VDEAGRTMVLLWTRVRARHSRQVPEAVENAAAMWTAAAENS
jgi:hypothetical protein